MASFHKTTGAFQLGGITLVFSHYKPWSIFDSQKRHKQTNYWRLSYGYSPLIAGNFSSWLVVDQTPLKNMSSSIGMMKFPIYIYICIYMFQTINIINPYMSIKSLNGTTKHVGSSHHQPVRGSKYTSGRWCHLPDFPIFKHSLTTSVTLW